MPYTNKQSSFYLMLLHSLRVICNLFLVIIENCFGIRDPNEEIYNLDLEDEMVGGDDLDTEVLSNSIMKGKQEQNHRPTEIRKTNRALTKVMIEPIRETTGVGASGKQDQPLDEIPISEIIEKAVYHPDQLQNPVEFAVLSNTEIMIRKGVATEHFVIKVFCGERDLLRIRKSLFDIRAFDRELKRKVTYELPELSTLGSLVISSSFAPGRRHFRVSRRILQV